MTKKQEILPKIVQGEEYVTAEQAMELLGISRPTFYEKPILYLRVYYFDGKKRQWYSKRQVLDLKEGRIAQNPVIPIEGMFKDWTAAARAMGVPATTTTSEVYPTTLPHDACETFGLSPTLPVLLRGRLTLSRGIYLCVWNSYWPLSLVEEFLPEIKANPDFSITGALAEQGVVVARAVEEVSTRHPSLREQEQMQMISNEPILVLQRACYSERGAFVLFSDMSLRGSFFKMRREYPVDHWK